MAEGNLGQRGLAHRLARGQRRARYDESSQASEWQYQGTDASDASGLEDGDEAGHASLPTRPIHSYNDNSSQYAATRDEGFSQSQQEPSSDLDYGPPTEIVFIKRNVQVWKRATEENAPTCTDLRQDYQAAYEQGIHILADQWIRENDGYGLLKEPHDIGTTGTTICTTALTMFPDILKAVLAGNLPARRRDPDPQYGGLRYALNRSRTRAFHCEKTKSQCIIYGHYLVNARSGLGPTYRELRELLLDVQKYKSDHDFANAIDSLIGGSNISRRDSWRGVRRYLNGKGQRTVLAEFCKALDDRITQELDQGGSIDDPMPAPLAEFGFTVKTDTRQKSHASHSGSNVLMNFFDALCTNRFGEEYGMEYFVLHCIPTPDLSPWAEAFTTSIGLGYSINGGGFNGHPAGLSTSGASTITEEQKRESWEWLLQHVDVVKEQKAFYDTMGEQVAALKEKERAMRTRWLNLGELQAVKKAATEVKATPGIMELMPIQAKNTEEAYEWEDRFRQLNKEQHGEDWEAQLIANSQDEIAAWEAEDATRKAAKGAREDEWLKRVAELAE